MIWGSIVFLIYTVSCTAYCSSDSQAWSWDTFREEEEWNVFSVLNCWFARFLCVWLFCFNWMADSRTLTGNEERERGRERWDDMMTVIWYALWLFVRTEHFVKLLSLSGSVAQLLLTVMAEWRKQSKGWLHFMKKDDSSASCIVCKIIFQIKVETHPQCEETRTLYNMDLNSRNAGQISYVMITFTPYTPFIRNR